MAANALTKKPIYSTVTPAGEVIQINVMGDRSPNIRHAVQKSHLIDALPDSITGADIIAGRYPLEIDIRLPLSALDVMRPGTHKRDAAYHQEQLGMGHNIIINHKSLTTVPEGNSIFANKEDGTDTLYVNLKGKDINHTRELLNYINEIWGLPQPLHQHITDFIESIQPETVFQTESHQIPPAAQPVAVSPAPFPEKKRLHRHNQSVDTYCIYAGVVPPASSGDVATANNLAINVIKFPGFEGIPFGHNIKRDNILNDKHPLEVTLRINASDIAPAKLPPAEKNEAFCAEQDTKGRTVVVQQQSGATFIMIRAQNYSDMQAALDDAIGYWPALSEMFSGTKNVITTGLETFYSVNWEGPDFAGTVPIDPVTVKGTKLENALDHIISALTAGGYRAPS